MKVEDYAKLIREGQIVAFPTETVYGLGADVWNEAAIAEVFKRKGRPSDNPLIVHISDIESLEDLASEIPDIAYRLAKAFWPGPLTLVLNKQDQVPDIVTAGLGTVAIRMPDHPMALKLIANSGPLVAPSANLSGKPSPTAADHVKEDFGDAIAILEGGPTRVGIESTVLDLSGEKPIILRPGAIGPEEIEKQTGIKVDYSSINTDGGPSPKSPGLKYAHYKPNARVRYGKVNTIESDTLYLLQEDGSDYPNVIRYNGDLNALSQELYGRFREADQKKFGVVHIAPIEAFRSAYPTIYQALKNRIVKAVDH